MSTLSAGQHTFTAQYGGAAGYSSSTSGSVTAATTTTTLTSSANPALPGHSVTFTAAVSAAGGGTPGTGTVTFYDGGTALGMPVSLSGGSATYTTSALSLATHTITASYSGGGTGPAYTSGTSAALSQIIQKSATTTVASASASTLAPGQAVTLSAKVSALFGGGTPTGSVTFTDGGTTLGTATLSGGSASLLVSAGLAAGTHAITVSYGGDSYDDASSGGLSLLVQAPADDPLQSTINCGCPDSPGSVYQMSTKAAGPQVRTSSADPVRYADGVVTIALTDLYSGDFAGFPWAQTRSWTNGAGYASGGVNGVGWVDTYTPQLLRADGSTTNTLVVVNNGTQAMYFDLTGGAYVPRFGSGQLSYSSISDTYTLLDPGGDSITFSGFGGSRPAAQRGEFSGYTDATGQTISVTSYSSAGNIGEVQRSVTTGGNTITESFLYSYLSSGANAGLLSNVTLRRQTNGGSWSTVRQVAYSYYDGTQAGGNLGDLMTAVVEDSTGAAVSTSYYRYYTPGEAGGYEHALEYVVNDDSYRRMTAALGTSLSGLTDAQVAAYADNAFEYDSSFRVSQEVVQGRGADSAGGLGTFTYSYTASANSPGENSWAMKTVETAPDGSTDTVYTNAYGQVMLDDHHDPVSGLDWDSFSVYDSAGQLILSAAPSAVSGYSDGYADLLHYSGGSYAYLNASSGLITLYDYYTSTTATATTAGGVEGYQQDEEIEQGQSGTPVLQETWQYFTRTVGSQTIAPLATDTVYRNDDGTGAETTSYAYTWYTGTMQEQSEAESDPVVSSGQNGPGTADVTTTYFDAQGRPVWVEDPDGFLTYFAYDPATGAPVKQITDVDTTQTSEFTGLPTGWATPTGGGLNLVTADVVDGLGRTTEETSPAGNVTYTVYLDSLQEVRVYDGWNSSTNLPTGPTEVYFPYETLTMSAVPHTTGGVPDGSEALSGVQSLSVDVVDAAGQVTAEDDYVSLSGLTFAMGVIGTSGTNYDRTQYGYDVMGRLDRTVTADGTIERTVYDSLDQDTSDWVGTDDTPASGTWSPTNNGGASNLVEVSASVYDGGGVGDGNLTQTTAYPGGGAAAEVTQFWYDWRDRLVAQKSGVQTSEDATTHRPIIYDTFDNLDEVVEQRQYDGDGVTITTSGGVPQVPSSSLLRAEVVYEYDDQGRVYRTQTYGVDPSTGAVSTYALTTSDYYDHRGDLVAESEPGGLWMKSVFDGAGRDVMDYTTDGAGGTTWAEANSVASDTVLEQTQTVYDGDDDAIETVGSQRFDDATGTGPLGTPTSGVGARVYYAATYFDAADRPTADVDVGTNGGTAWTRPSSVPTGSSTVLVTGYGYNAAGEVQDVTDPMGIDTRTYYDALGQTTEVVQDYTGAAETSDSDVATEYGYDGDGNVLYVRADEPGGTYQQTQYVYGVTTAGGSAIDSNDVLAAVEYPDPTTGAPSSGQEVTYTANALGQVTSMTDRDGNVHEYSYDVLGRQTADAVTTLGAGVDGSVRRIETAYDTQGNPYLVTSCDSASGGSIVNQVLRQYNGLGQLTAEYQSDSGAVNLSTTPAVQYAYTEMAGWANNSRLVSVTYPSGYVLNYDYGTAGGLDDTISRLQSLSDSSGTLESYKYLGLDTVVERDRPETEVELTYVSQTGSTGDAGDQYTGLDRFGRVVEQLWQDTGTGTANDDTQYGNDADGDVLYQRDLVDAALSELFSYDDLHQLTGYQVGTLDSAKTGLTGSASGSQSWGMDALGNWTSVTTNGTTQTRTANAQNEYTAVGGATPSYDANGNMTTDEIGKTLVYDAWDRLVAVTSGGTTVATYTYDGLGRQASVTEGGTTTQLIYSADRQVLEEQVGGATTARYVWSPVYVNALVLRDAATTTPGTLDQRLWAQQDANWDVTALTDGNGNVVERYTYSPFGVVTVLTPTFGSRGASSYGWVYLFQGWRYDGASGLYTFQQRQYSPTLGRWMTMDPLGFAAGDDDLYRFVGNDATNATDPSGLEIYGPSYNLNPGRGDQRAAEAAAMAAEKEKFIAWYDTEIKPENMKWLKDVPIPPDTLDFIPGTLYSGTRGPSRWVPIGKTVVIPKGWTEDSNFFMNVVGYHPNAFYGIRRRSKDGDCGAQAMYDKNGKIITNGLSAGTAGKVSSTVSVPRHRKADVIPFDLAWKLDKYYGGDTYRKLYREVRPPHVSETAPKNIVE